MIAYLPARGKEPAMHWRICLLAIALILTPLVSSHAVAAGDDDQLRPLALFDSGKLLATGGVSQLEGSAGGGLVPWALIAGYGTKDAIGASAHYTYVGLPKFELHSGGVAVGLFDRLELSYARQVFNTGRTGAQLGLGKGFAFDQDVLGAKVKLFGDAVFDQDRPWPQVAVGAQYKVNDKGEALHAIGARHRGGVDFYVAGTKLLLGQNLLVSAAVRETMANQFGILGFGGDRRSGYSIEVEASAAYLLSRQLALGAEYRSKPDNLRFARETGAADLFAVWFLTKNLAATVAYVRLGDIATFKQQNGVYVSLQTGF